VPRNSRRSRLNARGNRTAVRFGNAQRPGHSFAVPALGHRFPAAQASDVIHGVRSFTTFPSGTFRAYAERPPCLVFPTELQKAIGFRFKSRDYGRPVPRAGQTSFAGPRPYSPTVRLVFVFPNVRNEDGRFRDGARNERDVKNNDGYFFFKQRRRRDQRDGRGFIRRKMRLVGVGRNGCPFSRQFVFIIRRCVGVQPKKKSDNTNVA